MMLAPLFALLIAAAQPASAAASPTAQQQFDAATAALDAGRWAEAVQLFEALESSARSPRTLAIARIRRATALVELGRSADADAALRLALPALPADDRSLDSDRLLGLVALGQIAEARLDYDEAQRQFRLAAAIPLPEQQKLSAYRGLIQTQLFSDAPAALRDADTALRAVAATAPGDQPLEAQFHTLRGRALLNLARYAEAQAELELAMRQLGDLTLRVDFNDVVARSDLAIAALLAGDEDRARRYLAYTGAGRLQRGAVNPQSYDLPPCGGELSPDDVAVIQLGVADDGRVTYAMPIYASRQGPAALAFARAVTRWTLLPRRAGEVPDLLRAAVRVEVRCSAVADPDGAVEDGDTLLPRLIAADRGWAAAVAAHLNRPTPPLRAALASLEQAGGAGMRNAVPLLLILGDRFDVPFAERTALLRRALALAAAEQAPEAILAAIAVAAGRPQRTRLVIQGRSEPDPPDFEAILGYPEVSRAPRIAAMIRLAQGRAEYREGEYQRAAASAEAALRLVADAPPADPIAREARQLQVALAAARSDWAAARAAHQAMGADAPRCGLTPRHRRNSWSSADFPQEALRWGFAGWAVNELAFSADGNVAGARTVMAYPPFVFGDAAIGVSRRTDLYPTYIPDAAPCVYARQRIYFALPGR